MQRRFMVFLSVLTVFAMLITACAGATTAPAVTDTTPAEETTPENVQGESEASVTSGSDV